MRIGLIWFSTVLDPIGFSGEQQLELIGLRKVITLEVVSLPAMFTGTDDTVTQLNGAGGIFGVQRRAIRNAYVSIVAVAVVVLKRQVDGPNTSSLSVSCGGG